MNGLQTEPFTLAEFHRDPNLLRDWLRAVREAK
jgi:hypothetical protein